MTPLDIWCGIVVAVDRFPSYSSEVPEADRRMGSLLSCAATLIAMVIVAAIILVAIGI